MNGLVRMKDKVITVSSKDISDKFGKAHKNVLRDIETLNCSSEFRRLNFEPSTYTSTQNKVFQCYEITRDGFSILAMGFTGKKAMDWKEKYILAFNKMEDSMRAGVSVMDKINETIKLMEKDKDIARVCATGLNKWKKLKKNHEKEVKRLVDESQILLNLG